MHCHTESIDQMSLGPLYRQWHELSVSWDNSFAWWCVSMWWCSAKFSAPQTLTHLH